MIPYGACVMLEVYGVWHHHILEPLFSFVHTWTKLRRFQKSPLWRAVWKRSVFSDRFHRIRVDDGPNGIKKIYVFKPKRINVDGAWSSPVHQVPFPVYPFLHWQENEPLLFVQIPCWWQLWTLLVHSSTSVKSQSKVQTLFIG